MSKIYTLDSLHVESLLSPSALKQQLPAAPMLMEFISESRRQISNILNGTDPRLLLIVGPCSIHDINAAEEYAVKLRHLSKDVSRSFFIVMRAYFEKPRTVTGWKGMLYDPHLDQTHDIASGIRHARELLLTLAKLEIPAATEFLDPVTPRYLGDLISWACIGARTAESQVHRQFASGLAMPVAFKNSTAGNIEVAVNGAKAAAHPHTGFGIDDNGQISIVHTKGNRDAHIALRGGEDGPNYHPEAISSALAYLKKNHLPERIIIDCSHDNSFKQHEVQRTVFESVLDQYLQGNEAIRGLALESHLFGGNQRIPLDRSRLQYAVSITDPCLDWENTEQLVRWADAMIASKEAVAADESKAKGS